MKKQFFTIAALFFASVATWAQNTYQYKTANSAGYEYKYVTNDPSNTRIYTLKNGLTVILSPNAKEPSIQYRMSVRAGSNTDPRTHTGLAHYLEHLLFKGTDKYGSADWAKEQPLLAKIDALYEKYNQTTDSAARKEIYKEIDKTSGEASNYSIAGEYDKMISAMGGNSTNAHTWYEETVYNDGFPSNSVDKFLALQAERFRNPIFRIFHTELEAVYEEKNRSLDSDGNKMDEAMMALLFPTHNYGQQTTIGTIEHLKNPSLVEIRNYYNKYYVPNNMAAIFTGDFNPDEMIAKVDKAFAYMVPKDLELYNPAPEKPLTSIQKVDIYGPSAEMVELYYRGFSENSKESMLLNLAKKVLSNGKAGLLDINLNKQQKTLKASAGYQQMKDYGVFSISTQPRQGQSLEEATQLLIAQVDSLKQGKFDDKLLKAIVANNKLDFLQAFDSNDSRAEILSTEFILNRATKWDQSLGENEASAKVTKAELVAFANAFFKDNYVIGFKHKGVDKNTIKVDKPQITPINPNAGLISSFAKNNIETPVNSIEPKFLDYKKDIISGKAGIADVLTIKNTENSIFRMTYRFNVGVNHNKLMPYASAYLAYLATDKYSAEEISKQFYNIACTYNLSIGAEQSFLSISGLQENFDEAVRLVEHVFANVKPNAQALESLKGTIFKSRENAKLNKGSIMNGLTNYAQYGSKNPFNNVLSNEEVKNLKAEDLISIINSLGKKEHSITYYGPKNLKVFTADLKKQHNLPKQFEVLAPAFKYTYAKQDENQVYFANYEMVQSEIRWFRNAGLFNPTSTAKVSLFNNYFGGGMGSVVFQTIRESKALAYSTFAVYQAPDKTDKQYAMIAYVGSQSDKMVDALNGMNELLNDLPRNEKSFEGSKDNELNVMKTERITKDGIFAAYFADKKLGFDTDSRAAKFEGLKALKFDDIKLFHNENIAKKPYTYCIVASDKRVKQEDMAKYGKVNTLTLEQIFGY
ncbi:MAG: insulinase family protein [Sphingobacteriaceae bacterium]|nr:insulinase family protein [Sphingobacteriaceae bacterium]